MTSPNLDFIRIDVNSLYNRYKANELDELRLQIKKELKEELSHELNTMKTEIKELREFIEAHMVMAID